MTPQEELLELLRELAYPDNAYLDPKDIDLQIDNPAFAGMSAAPLTHSMIRRARKLLEEL